MRELDESVAVTVMGWHQGDGAWIPLGWESDLPLPEYSTSISAAFEVIERMRELGYTVEILSAVGWWIQLKNSNPIDTVSASGPDLPDCIARAALAAIKESK